jgi:hypothetical protein
MPDPISGGPKPPLPNLPGVQPNTRVGTSTPTVTAPAVASGQVEDPIRDVMDRTRNAVTPGNLPAYNRSLGGTPNNGGVRSLDLRLDADGAGIRGRREDTLPNGTRERTGSVVLDRGGAQVDVGSRTDVRGNGTANVRNNTLNVRLGANGVSGGATHRDTLEVDDLNGNFRRRDRGGEFSVSGGMLGFRGDGTSEHRTADGNATNLRGAVDGHVDANSVRLNADGRVENVTPTGRTDLGGGVTVTRDRDGNGAADVRGDGSITRGGVTWGGAGGARTNTDGNHGFNAAVTRGETRDDGALNLRGAVDLGVTPTGGRLAVEGRVEDITANRRTDAGGGLTVTRDGDIQTLEVRGDARTTAGDVTWAGNGGLRAGNTPGGALTVERSETRTDGTVVLRGGVDADAQGVRLNANGEHVSVVEGTRTTDRGNVTVNAGTTTVDVNAEVIRTREKDGERVEMGGRGGVTVAEGEVTGALGGGYSDQRTEGDTTTTRVADATVRGSTRGTVGANVRGGYGRTNPQGRLELRADGDATLGPGRNFNANGGADFLKATEKDDGAVTWRGGVRTNGGLPTATVVRDSQNAETGRSNTVEWRGDFLNANGTLRGADRVTTPDGGARERGVTLEVDAANRTAGVGVVVSNTAANGSGSDWGASVDGRVGGNGVNPGGGLGVEHTLRAGDGTALRGSGRVEADSAGFSVAAALDETLENNASHGVAGRVGLGANGVEGAVARTRTNETGSRTESFGVDHDGVTAGLSTTDPRGNTLAGTVGVGRNQVLGSLGTVTRTDTTATSTDLRAGFSRTGVDAMVARAHEWQGKLGTMSLSGAGRVTVSRECVDEGPVTDVEALKDLHRVTYKGTRELGAGAGGGLRVGVVTAGVSGMAQTGREVIYVTHLTAEAAAKASANPPPPPDLARPLELRTFDTLSVRQKGKFTLSADVGAYGVSVGGRLTFEGDTTLSVTRLADSRVQVTLTPQHVRSVAAEARAVVAMVGVEGSKAHALSQTFEFDLSTAAGQRAYERALDGEMPAVPVDLTLSRAAEAVDAVQTANATLPAGVKVVGIGVEDTRRIVRSWSVSWAFLSNEGSNTNSVTETRRAVHGNVTTARTASIERAVSTWFSGTERVGLFSTVSTRTDRDDQGGLRTAFQDLLVGWRFDDEKNSGKEFNQETLPELRTALGWSLQELPEDSVKERRTMAVELRLTEAHLDTLTSNPQAVQAAAREAGVDDMFSRNFNRAMQGAQAAADKAHAVQKFMETLGMRALGTLVRALPRDATVVQVQATGYQEALSEGQGVVGRFPEAPKPEEGRKGIMDRFHDVWGAHQKVTVALARLLRDDVMDQGSRDALRGQLEETRRGLALAMDFTGWTVEERRTLHDECLSSGWVKDEALLRVLEKAGIDDPDA